MDSLDLIPSKGDLEMPRKGTGAGGRPPKPPDEKMVTMSIVVDPAVRDQLRDIARTRGISISSLAQEILKTGLAASKQTP